MFLKKINFNNFVPVLASKNFKDFFQLFHDF